MDAEYKIGQRLLIKRKTTTLEGDFYSMDPDRQTLTLTEVVLYPPGKKIKGCCHYFRNEVTSSKFIHQHIYVLSC